MLTTTVPYIFVLFNPHNKDAAVIALVLQMKKLRLREDDLLKYVQLHKS